MSGADEQPPIPSALSRYVRDPVPERYTTEIFDDWNAIVDAHRIGYARGNGSTDPDETIIVSREKQLEKEIERRRASFHDAYSV